MKGVVLYMDIITDVVEVITGWVTGFTTMIINLLNDFIPLFYSDTDGLTFFGVLLLFGIGVGLIYFAINFIRRMIP